jgi:hypothetical protein
MCEKYKMSDAKPVITPTDMGILSKLRSGEPSTAEESIDMAKVPYREMIGRLLFLSTRTRPDIAVAVGIVARRVSDPRQVDWIASKRILRYLKGTASFQLRFSAEGEVELTTYADADDATSADRKSISGNALMIGNNALIGWTSQKQKPVALSTAEAEYIAQSEAVRETVWLRNILSDLGFTQKEPTSVYQDNTTAIAWSHEEAYSKRGKDIDVRYHYTMDQVKVGNVRVQFTGTKDMVADVMTKPLSGEELRRRRDRLQWYQPMSKKE